MKENAKFQLTIGSKYNIRSLESKESPLLSQGTFKGYTAFGHGDALCIELDETHGDDKGRLRVIPVHMIVAVDVLSVVEDTEAKDPEENARYFG